MSCVVEVVNSVDANGQSVEENPTANQVEQVVTHILIHRNPVQERKRERERERESPPSLSPSPPPSPSLPSSIEIKPFSVWWSTNRIDYSLEAPRDLESCTLLPLPAFSHVIHSRYWEAKELVSFILRQVRHLFYICA